MQEKKEKEFEIQMRNEKNKYNRSELLRGLETQLKENQHKRELEMIEKKKNSKAFVDTYSPYCVQYCSHKQTMYSCSICNRKFPLNYLTKRSKSLGIISK